MNNTFGRIISGATCICAFTLCAIECTIVKSYLDKQIDDIGAQNKLRVATIMASSYFLVGTGCSIHALGFMNNDPSLMNIGGRHIQNLYDNFWRSSNKWY